MAPSRPCVYTGAAGRVVSLPACKAFQACLPADINPNSEADEVAQTGGTWMWMEPGTRILDLGK